MAEGEKVVVEFHQVKHKKQPGVLLLTSARVAWSPGEIVQAFEINHPYHQIKAQRISAETSSKIQLQLILQSGSHVNFHFTASNALEQRKQVKDHLARALATSTANLISPEIEAKNNLLKSNPSLYQLYRDVVTTGLITAEEFWANQALLNDASEPSQGQEGGLPSAFLADVQAVYDGCNAVRYNLSVDAMHAIFKTYPLVKKKHSEMVPHKLKEEEFWTQFFQSQFLHEKNSEKFVDCLSAAERTWQPESSKELNMTETTTNILGEEGYSIMPKCQATKTSPLLVQRCNHHSNSILHALQGGESPGSLSTSYTSSPPPAPSRQHLTLALSQDTEGTVEHSSAALLPLAQTLSTWQFKQDGLLPNSHSTMAHFAPGGMLMSSGHGQKGSTVLTKTQQEQVFRHQMALAELLRHFWCCFPAKTTKLEAKAHKMHQCLLEYSDKQLRELEQLLDSADSLGVIKHFHECISKASDHYHKWASRKKTQPHRT